MRILVAICLLAVAASQEFIGYGAQRLSKDHRSNGKSLLKGGLLGAVNCDEVESLIFDGAVKDNFASSDATEYWQQRYWLNKKNWSGVGGPIFVFIGGEGEEACGRLTNRMYLYDLAKVHGALLVDVEHRFYGASMPTPDASTASLSLLSAEQSLADLARIITKVKTDLNAQSSKVITIGGSYPGNLAAWFRLKYPQITHGSIASSAPLRAKVDFSEYMDVVAQSLEHFSGQTCVAALEKAANAVADLFSGGVGSIGMTTVEKDFNTCSPITSRLDLAVLLSDLMGNIQGTIQYNNEHMGVMNATDVCSIMTTGSDPYGSFVALAGKYREANGQVCEDASFEDTIAYLGNATLAIPANAARSWVYQTCNEFGYFQTATSQNQPFKAWGKVLDVSFSMEICRRAYDGWSKEPHVEWSNTLYGGDAIDATNIVFTSGTVDPWHALGVTNFSATLPQSSETPVYITGTAHCNDLYAPNAESDPPSLVFARQVVADKVAEFLA